MEAVFQRIEGVVSVRSGYAGGAMWNSIYEQVCTGTTGHAEVIQVAFDPAKIPDPIVTEIAPLDAFWKAEEYHQKYYDSNRNAGYCRLVISPKLRKLKLE